MKTLTWALTLAALVLGPMAAQAQPLVDMIPLDSETSIGGIGAACTGIGQMRDDPRWLAYPVRVEISDAKNAYLAGEIVQVRAADGKPLLNAECDGPWLLLKLPKGRYVVQARLIDYNAKPRSAPVTAPSSGQVRVVLQFTDVDQSAQPPAH